MNVQLVTAGSRKWLAQDAVPTWGLGVQVQEVAEADWSDEDDDYRIEHHGWMVEAAVGPWLLIVWTGDAWAGWHGPNHHPQPFFERVWP